MWLQQLHAHIKRTPWFWFRFLLLVLSFSITEKNVYFRKDRQQPSCNTGYDGILITDMLSLNLEEVRIKTEEAAINYASLVGSKAQVSSLLGLL